MAKKLKKLDLKLLENVASNTCVTLIKANNENALTKYFARIMNQITHMNASMKLVLYVLERFEKPIAVKIIQ